MSTSHKKQDLLPRHIVKMQTSGNACRKLASSYPKLVHFEICVLANLAPGDAEEAKLMIPSIVVSSTLAAELQYGSCICNVGSYTGQGV